MGLDPKSTEKEKVSVWMVVALMMGVVGLLGGPEKGEMFFFSNTANGNWVQSCNLYHCWYNCHGSLNTSRFV